MESIDVFVYVKEIAVLVVALGGGALAVPIVRQLKQWLNTSGNWTVLVAVLVSVTLGILGLVAEGELTPDTVQPENLSTWGLAIFVASQVIYQMLKDKGVVEAPAQ